MSYKMCNNCVMDTSDPSIEFDDKGQCSHCNSFYEKTLPTWKQLLADKKALKRLKEDIKKRSHPKSNYDCLIGLSGGIDSSLVSSVAQDLTTQQLKTFSIGFDNPKYNEAQYAKEVANYIKSDHHEFRVTENEAKYLVDDLIKQYDEPFGDPSSIPTMDSPWVTVSHPEMWRVPGSDQR